MKHYLLPLALGLLLSGCAAPTIGDLAISAVKKVYPDCGTILHVSVDTVTYRDNLNYRVELFQNSITREASMRDYYLQNAREFKSYGSSGRRYVKEYEADAAKQDSIINVDLQIIAALDSLGKVHADILDTPTAYTVCVAYNYPSNLVWVQLNKYGDLLKISKNLNDMLLNPGEDVPGYFELLTTKFGY